MYLVLALLAAAPVFRADRVLPSSYDRPAPMQPGMLFSIYGENLGPGQGCVGQPKIVPRDRAPAVAVYPPELCGVQVLLGDKAAGLLWAQASQINFQVPEGVPMETTAPLRVIFNSVSSAAVNARLSALAAELTVDQPATTMGPVWVEVAGPPGAFPEPSYPFRLGPADFGCTVFEVRRHGAPVPRVPFRGVVGFVTSGSICGSLALPAPEPPRNRIPLHLAWRFDQPGEYEVRYSYRPGFVENSPATPYSTWTRFEVRAGTAEERRRWLEALPVPASPQLLITSYIPSLLGIPDAASLRLLTPLLYHPDSTVRDFALRGMGFWPDADFSAAARRALKERGPSDGVIRLLREKVDAPELIPCLQSPDPVLRNGALFGMQALFRTGRAGPDAIDAVLAARERFLRSPEAQTRINYVSLLGSVHDERAGRLLWQVAEGGRAESEQALVALSWRKDPADLPKLAARLSSPSMPYVLRDNYGEAALPYLESALTRQPRISVRAACARELILANRPSGFAFVLDAIEQNSGIKSEMVSFLKGQFPELHAADEAAVAAWLRPRAK